MHNLIIIPARGGSKRLPGKNIKNLIGKPLIGYTIEAAKNSEVADKIIVNTDNIEIASLSKDLGAEIPFIRDAVLASDSATTLNVLKDTITFYENKNIFFENLILLQPTSPLRNDTHIKEAFKLFLNNDRMPVLSAELKDVQNKLFALGESEIFSKLTYDKLAEINGAIYITRVDNIKNGYIHNNEIIPYYMDRVSSIDIDTELDFKLAEFYLMNILRK